MDEVLLIISAAIHIFAAIVWIGGIFFILFVALPSVRKTLEQPSPLMGALSKRFVPMANMSILMIFVTGILMGFSSHNLRTQTLLVKVIITLIMASIHFYRSLVLTPRISKLTVEGGHSEQVGRLQRFSLNLVKMNFLFGLTVLLITGILYAYRG